jgi:hypothetical protein
LCQERRVDPESHQKQSGKVWERQKKRGLSPIFAIFVVRRVDFSFSRSIRIRNL